MKAYLKAVSYYLPEKVLTNQDLNLLFPEWAVEKIAQKIGVHERHIAADHEFTSDMGIAAAKNLFSEYNINPADIDFVLFCTQSPDYFLPSTSCIIQDKLKIPVTAGALDFNLGCSGYIYGLAIAKGLIAASIATNILLITSETYSKFIHKNDKGNRTIFGDAAAASVISTTGFAEIGEFELGTNGEGAENLIVKKGGMRYPKTKINVSSDLNEDEHSGEYLFMNGPEIFSFTSKEVPPLIDQILLKNSLLKSDIDLFIFHQANQFMLEHLRKKIEIDPNKFYADMMNVGNTVSSTIPIAICDKMKKNKVPGGAKWLLAGFGVGYSWGSTILKFD